MLEQEFESFNNPISSQIQTVAQSRRICLKCSYFSPYLWHRPKLWDSYKLDQEAIISSLEKWVDEDEISSCCTSQDDLIQTVAANTPSKLVENFEKLSQVPTFGENMEAALGDEEDLLSDPIFSLAMEELGASKLELPSSAWLKSSKVLWKCLSAYKSIDLSIYNFLNNERVARMIALHITRHTLNYITRDSSVTRRDQGWGPTRVLIVTPTKHHALGWLENLRILSANKDLRKPGKRKKRKIHDKYQELVLELSDLTDDGEIDAESALGLSLLRTNKRKVRKPLDFIDAFRGNNDDDFIFGLEWQDESYGLRVLQDYQQAGIVVTSSSTLMKAISRDQAVTGEGESESEDDSSDSSTQNYSPDYEPAQPLRQTKCTWLSSIEICVIDRADHLIQSNCENLLKVVEELNLRPAVRPKGVDISKLRQTHMIDPEQSVLMRQTILLSQGRHNILGSLMRKADANCRGAVTLWRAPTSSIARSIVKTNVSGTTFLAVSASGPEELADVFRRHFVDSFHARLGAERTIIVAPSYLEFVELQQMVKAGVSTDNYVSCHEESEEGDINEARRMIHDGACLILLVTERFLFHRRIRLSGFEHVVYFGAPRCPGIFVELCANARGAANSKHVVLIYWDKVLDTDSMARILGASNMQKALSTKNSSNIPLLVVADLVMKDGDNR